MATDPKVDADRALPLIIDGLQVCNWEADLFRRMQAGGVTAANCTCAVWEGAKDTLATIGKFERWFQEMPTVMLKVQSTADILEARESGRVGIIFGFQNSSPIEDRAELVGAFKGLGVGIIQMTYNTQNFVGSGCYETHDSGLSDFGHDVLAEMNRFRVVCDLSHVGPRTTADCIAASTQPVVYSHASPLALHDHSRNKSDDELRAIAETGGLVGVTPFPWFLRHGRDSTVDDFLEAVEHVVDVVGEESVGIGTDFIDGYDDQFIEWIMRDKGFGRNVGKVPLDAHFDVRFPEGLRLEEDFPALADHMRRRGWSEQRVERVCGLNWLRVLGDIWGE